MITTHTGARSWRNQRGRHRPTAVPGRIPAPPGDRPGVRPTARSEALPEPRPRAQAMALRRSRRQPYTGLKPSPPPGSAKSGAARIELGEGRAAVADAGPDLIHDLRIYVRRLCALSDLLPRPPGARPMRRALRKEVAWPCRCRGRAIGTSSRWKCCRSSAMPIRISIRKPRPRARACSEIAHDEMYANLQTERFQAMLRLLGAARDPRRHGRARAPVAVSRARPPPRGWDAALRAPG